MQAHNGLPRTHRHVWQIAAALVLAAIAVGLFLFFKYWPFQRDAVVRALRSGLSTNVQIAKFHEVFFPHPGCVMDGVVIGSSLPGGTPPPVTIQQLEIEGSYTSFLKPGTQISSIRARGLHLLVPTYAHATDAKGFPHVSAGGGSKFSIDQLSLENAAIEIASAPHDRDPLLFTVYHAQVGPVANGRVTKFDVKMKNPKPRGEIQCAGQIGPWNSKAADKTPLSGDFSFQQADLSTFPDIAGKLNARGKFTGRLGDLAVNGSTDVPDFEITRTKHSEHLKAAFDASVNCMNGDTNLKSVSAQFGKTSVSAQGSINGNDKEGKTTSLSMCVRNGRVQDILHMFTQSDPPALTGPIDLTAKAVLPPERGPFIRTLRLDGTFAMQKSRFTKPATKENIKKLSERARGITDDSPESIESDSSAAVSLRDGVAHLSHLSFHVPGATAKMAGTYSLVTERVNLVGTLRMEAELSQSTKGVKSFLLKFIDPLFRHKKAGAVVPVKLGGTYSHPTFGLAIASK
jgi:AsmA-like protein